MQPWKFDVLEYLIGGKEQVKKEHWGFIFLRDYIRGLIGN